MKIALPGINEEGRGQRDFLPAHWLTLIIKLVTNAASAVDISTGNMGWCGRGERGGTSISVILLLIFLNCLNQGPDQQMTTGDSLFSPVSLPMAFGNKCIPLELKESFQSLSMNRPHWGCRRLPIDKLHLNFGGVTPSEHLLPTSKL